MVVHTCTCQEGRGRRVEPRLGSLVNQKDPVPEIKRGRGATQCRGPGVNPQFGLSLTLKEKVGFFLSSHLVIP